MIALRFAVLQAYALWQGGFVFYAAAVVPIGTELLGSELAQGLITQRVTHWLNLIGLAFHAIALWEAVVTTGCRRSRLALLSASLAGHAALLILHASLDGLLVEGEISRADRPHFRSLHVAYLWTSTGQWILGMVWCGITLRAWRGKPGNLQN